MSHVPYTTQIGPYASMRFGSQAGPQLILVFKDGMEQHHASLMKDAQLHLEDWLNIQIVHGIELKRLPSHSKYFVISHPDESLIKRIRDQFDKPMIYTARAIIEARGYYRVPLPSRTLAISLSMFRCHIFLTKSCNTPEIRQKIHEMCGTLVEKFNDDKLNVIITTRSDDKYCLRAVGRKVAIVPKDWVKECHEYSSNDDPTYFQHDALKTLDEHQIKPFHGLQFRLDVPHSINTQIKKLITDNQGKMSYGGGCFTTHIVRLSPDGSENQHRNGTNQPEVKVVNVEFLEACVRAGHYLSDREYCDYRQATTKDPLGVKVKQENLSQSTVSHHTNARSDEAQSTTPTLPSATISSYASLQSERRTKSNESQATIMPPPKVPRPNKQPSDMDDMILKAIRGFENGAQTQLASTQMSRLPENEIRIERQVEPSQQIYWG